MQCWSQWCHMTKRENVAYHFYCLYLRKNYTIYNAVCILWHWSWFLWYYVTPTPIASYHASGNCVSWQKSHVTSNFDCLDLSNAMVTLRMLTVSCDDNTSVNSMAWQKSHVLPHFYHIDQRNAMMLLAASDIDTGTMTRKLFLPHFYHLDMWNVMVLLKMPAASCDTDSGANGVKWPERHVALHFEYLDLKSGMMQLTMLFVSHMMLMPVPMPLYDQESHVVPHFFHLD